MTDEFDRMMWAYRAVFKQTDVGGGNVVVNISPYERMVVLYGLIGPNDYAAGRAVNGLVRDEDGTTIAYIMNVAALDNNPYPFPSMDISEVAALDGPDLRNRLTLGKGDYLRFAAAALVQNEELTIAIRALIGAQLPAVTTTGSGGTVTTTESYNKVI